MRKLKKGEQRPSRGYIAAGTDENGDEMDHLTVFFRQFIRDVGNDLALSKANSKYRILLDVRPVFREHTYFAWRERLKEALQLVGTNFSVSP